MPRKISSLFIASLLFLSRGDAHAFSSYGQTWSNRAGNPVIYTIQPDGSDDIADGSDLEAVRRAFRSWDNVACSYLEFAEGVWSEPRVAAPDNTNRIIWVENQNEWTDSPSILALTYTWGPTTPPTIIDGDMRINGVNFRWTTNDAEIGQGTPARVDLETTLLHEAGHFLGLDHSADPMAAMFASANKPMQRTPAFDDVQGVCTLYPNGMGVPGQNGQGGAVGSPCLSNADCASSLCANDSALNRLYCTAPCGPTSPCPSGYVCETFDSGALCVAPLVPDEICDQCDVGSQCASGFCVRVVGTNGDQPFCSKPCDPTPGQPAQCPSGFSCIRLSDSAIGGTCAPNNGVCEPKGKGGQNEACFGNGTCKPGLRCVDYFPNAPQLGHKFCYVQCPTAYAGQSCTPEGGTLCASVADNLAVCFNVAREGEPCVPELCDETTFCAYDRSVDDAQCYRLCPQGTNCGPNTQCQQFEGLPPLCVPLAGAKREGEACSGDEECTSRTCRTYGQNRLCTKACSVSDASSCGRGFKCLAAEGASQGQCWPASFGDPGAGDPTRQVTASTNFCACDSTRSCDQDCPCDPECATSGCGCASTSSERSGLGLLGLMLVAFACARRTRR